MATPRLAKLKLQGADGGPLFVDLRTSAREGEGRPGVIVCHGFKGFKNWGFFPRLAERLALAGFTAASFNFSGSGVGDGEEFDLLDRWAHQKPTNDLKDIETVADHLSATGSRRLALVGHSRGGGLAILHAAADARVRALVTWAAIAHFQRWPEEEVRKWRETGRLDVVNARTGQVLPILTDALDDFESNRERLDITAAAGRVSVPWLIVHGEADESVSVSEAQQLRVASGSPSTELIRLKGAGHTFGARHPWAGTTPDFDHVMDRTVAFLSQHLA